MVSNTNHHSKIPLPAITPESEAAPFKIIKYNIKRPHNSHLSLQDISQFSENSSQSLVVRILSLLH